MNTLLVIVSVFIMAVATPTLGAPGEPGNNCIAITNCEECLKASCFWVRDLNITVACHETPTVLSPEIDCVPDNTTTTVDPPTTTPPTTTTTTSTSTTTTTTTPKTTSTSTSTTPNPPPPTTTTTEEPTTVTTTEPTTETTTETPTEPPTTISTTEAPETTTTVPPSTTPTPDIPTTDSPTTTSTELPSTTVPGPTPSPSCSGHHFDAGSFFGGIFLALGVIVVSYAGVRFYRARNGRSYNQLQTVY